MSTTPQHVDPADAGAYDRWMQHLADETSGNQFGHDRHACPYCHGTPAPTYDEAGGIHFAEPAPYETPTMHDPTTPAGLGNEHGTIAAEAGADAEPLTDADVLAYFADPTADTLPAYRAAYAAAHALAVAAMTGDAALAADLAADIVATADTYPAIRSCGNFAALHDVYDVNESVLAATDGECAPEDPAWMDAVNAATAAVDAALRAAGWPAVVAMATEAQR